MPRLKKIMVVDDEPGIRNILFDVLSGEGFSVTLAEDGLDSLEYLRKRSFDLLITDINMPRLDGIGLLRKMKKAGRKERLIVMTGGAFDRTGIEKEIPQVVFHLKKPFYVKHLLDAVHSALSTGTKKSEPVNTEQRNKRAVHAI